MANTSAPLTALKAFFFDMDGTLFDSMPCHARSWDEVMKRHGLSYPPEECYRGEGRTGREVVATCVREQWGREATEQEMTTIYQEKAERFRQQGPTKPVQGVTEVLRLIAQQPHTQIWIVTGSGQKSLFDSLENTFPGIFSPERMVTAFDVTHGKPHPEPYLKAYERSGLSKEQCCVIENAPMGIRSAKAAGLFTFGINTGPLPDSDLLCEGADIVLPTMNALLKLLQQQVFPTAEASPRHVGMQYKSV